MRNITVFLFMVLFSVTALSARIDMDEFESQLAVLKETDEFKAMDTQQRFSAVASLTRKVESETKQEYTMDEWKALSHEEKGSVPCPCYLNNPNRESISGGGYEWVCSKYCNKGHCHAIRVKDD